MTLDLTTDELALLRAILEQTAACADRMSFTEHLGLDFDPVTGKELVGVEFAAMEAKASATFASLQTKLA